MPYSRPTNFVNNINKSVISNREVELLVFYSESGERKSYTGDHLIAEQGSLQAIFKINKVIPREKILIVIPFSFRTVASILALMAMGAIPVIPPPLSSFFALIKFLYKEEIKTIIVSGKFLVYSLIFKLIGLRIIVLPENFSESSSPLIIENVPENRPAIITYTSGSTASSKKILRSHKTLQEQHLALKKYFPPIKGQIDFPLFSTILLHNLSLGIKSIIPQLPAQGLKDVSPQIIVQQLEKEKVQTLTGNVFYFNKILNYLNSSRQQFVGVEAIGIGGSPVPEVLLYDLKKFFPNADIYVIYGSSEAEPISIRHFSGEDMELLKGYNVGVVHPAVTLKIKKFGEIIINNKKYNCGEILVKGNHVVVSKGEEYLNTGDFGFIDERNKLHLTGRKGNETLHRNVQHYQVEHVLQHVKGVEQIACKSVQEGFKIYIKGEIEEEAVRHELDKFFPKELKFSVLFLSQIPVDTRHYSKIIYKSLK